MSSNKRDFAPFDEDFEVVYIEDENSIANVPEEDTSKQKNTNRRAPNKHRKASPVKAVSKAGGSAVKTGGKIVKTTTKGALKVIQVCSHAITLVLIAWIMFLIATKFWSTHFAFGSLNTAVTERNTTLAAYLGVAVFLLVFELISFLWAMTSPRTNNKIIGGKQDVGRGLFSFLIIGIFSLLSSMFGDLIPEAHTALIGLKQGLAMYGSLFEILLPLCIAGIISCLIRRFAPR